MNSIKKNRSTSLKLRNILSLIQQLSQLLGKVPSIIYGLIYLLLIPLFALLYWLLPYSFYHSTVQYENSLESERQGVERAIEQQLELNFIQYYGSEEKKMGEWSFNGRWFRVDGLSFNRQGFEFFFNPLLVRPKPGEKIYWQTFSPRINVIATWDDITIGYKGMDCCLHFYSLTFNSKDILSFDITDFFPPPPIDSLKFEKNKLVLPSPLVNKLQTLSNAYLGMPSDARSDFARMLYFSAITITTVGYGDIVPITSTARILVAFEAILGIVLIGMFLNALAHEFRRRDLTGEEEQRDKSTS